MACIDSQKSEQRIAVLITCYNRKDTTLACLKTLFGQVLPSQVRLDVYLVDDASTDGTSDAVRQTFPTVHILNGSGLLYWSGGTRLAWQQALKKQYCYYLWLNDDTCLTPNALDILLAVDKTAQKIVVGSCCDPITGEHTYGGRIRRNTRIQLPTEPILPEDRPIHCETMNGNIVLVPQFVVDTVGILSSEYTHTIGDVDYGLRAQKAGLSVLVAPGYLGKCARHKQIAAWTDPHTSLLKRLKNMCEPKGFPPREWYVYVRRHTGYQWPFYFVKPFVRVLFPWLWPASY
ncbi:glycosyltransferase family 2 protein [Planctomycetota bacterium]